MSGDTRHQKGGENQRGDVDQPRCQNQIPPCAPDEADDQEEEEIRIAFDPFPGIPDNSVSPEKLLDVAQGDVGVVVKKVPVLIQKQQAKPDGGGQREGFFTDLVHRVGRPPSRRCNALTGCGGRVRCVARHRGEQNREQDRQAAVDH